MSITPKHFEKILEQFELHPVLHEEDSLIEFFVEHPSLCGAKLKFLLVFPPDSNLIVARGFPTGADLKDSDHFQSARLFCNRWNAHNAQPKVFVDEEKKRMFCDWNWHTDFQVNDTFAIDQVIKPYVDQAHLKFMVDLIVDGYVGDVIKCVRSAIREGLYPTIQCMSDETRD